MSVYYRGAIAADAGALADIGARTFTHTFGHLYQPDDLEIFLQNHSPENWQKELGDPAFEVRVAECDGSLVGYAKLGPPHLPFEPRGEAAGPMQRMKEFPAEEVLYAERPYLVDVAGP